MFTTVVAAAVAYVAGAFFTPVVLRKVKAYFVKETDAAKAAVVSDVKAAEKKL